jgi:hypothetical protein
MPIFADVLEPDGTFNIQKAKETRRSIRESFTLENDLVVDPKRLVKDLVKGEIGGDRTQPKNAPDGSSFAINYARDK